ncbi:hypothetical protein SDC9_48802 [bioreactor metagenome]|uniref:Uncharacterized protein n=1 Tax=bioreactor metagenome TaxID=1076179 RepID=A0A644WJ63_9ZZZZ
MHGVESGKSILFSRRNPSFDQWDGTQYTMDIDQPRMKIGFCFGMLVTEYKLLKDNGPNASVCKTLTALNLALDALIRMNKYEDDTPWNYFAYSAGIKQII